MFEIFPLNFPCLSSLALLGDPIASRNQLLLRTRQWRKPENWHHPTRKWQDWSHSHERLHLVTSANKPIISTHMTWLLMILKKKLLLSSFSGTTTAGMSATWPGQTSRLASGGGRLWMRLHRRRATVHCFLIRFQLICRWESSAWNSPSSIFIAKRPVQMWPCLSPGHQARGNMLPIWCWLCVRRSESPTTAAPFA